MDNRLLGEIMDAVNGLQKLKGYDNREMESWTPIIMIPEGKKEEWLTWFKHHTVVSQDVFDQGKIMINGITMEIRESRAIIMIDTNQFPEKRIRASNLTASQYMII